VNIHQRLHQEQDPRARRTFIAVLLVCATLVGGALGVVGLRVQQVHLAYQLDRLRSERQQIETSIRQLEVEVATLQSPSRVEQRARQLGLVTPAPQQVRLAREYVPAGTGLAAAHRSRVAVVPDGEAGIPIR
jgi:cell division protein FtsL